MAVTASSLHLHHHHLRRQNPLCLPSLRQPTSLLLPKSRNKNRALKSSLAEQSQSQGQDLKLNGLVDFLYDDLPHLFDDQGIDPSMYDDRVKFRDPITKHDTVGGYLFNIRLLKGLFDPKFELHSVRQVIFLGTLWVCLTSFIVHMRCL